MGQRSPTELAAFEVLVTQVDQLDKAAEVIAGKHSPTGQRSPTDALISGDEHKQLQAQIKQLRATIVQMAGQRSST